MIVNGDIDREAGVVEERHEEAPESEGVRFTPITGLGNIHNKRFLQDRGVGKGSGERGSLRSGSRGGADRCKGRSRG